MSGKYSQKLLDHAKQTATDALKTTSKRVIQKTAEAIGDFIYNKIADAVAKYYDRKITKISKIHKKIILRQLQKSMMKKYLKKYIYLQKKEKKLLIN